MLWTYWNKNIIIVLILIGAMVLMAGNLSFNAPYYDEALHIVKGRAILRGDFSYDPLGTTFGLGLFYPPLAAILDKLGGLKLVRFFSTTMALLALFMIYKIGDLLFDQYTAILSMVILILQAPFIFISHFATQDMLALSLFTCSMFLSALGYKYPHRRHIYLPLSMIVLFMASLAKYTVVLLAGPMLLVILYCGRNKKLRTVIIMLAILLYGGYFIGVILPHLSKQILTITTTQKANITPTSMIARKLLKWIWAPGLLTLFSFHDKKKRLHILLFLAASIIIPAYHLIFSTSISFHKHVAYPLIFLSLTGGKGFRELICILDILRFQKGVKSFTFLMIPLLLFPYELREIHRLDHLYPDTRKAANYLINHVKEGDIILADSAMVYKYYLPNRNIHIYGTYFFKYRDLQGDKGIIEFVKMGIPHFVILDWYGRADLDKDIVMAMNDQYGKVFSYDGRVSWGKRNVEIYENIHSLRRELP